MSQGYRLTKRLHLSKVACALLCGIGSGCGSAAHPEAAVGTQPALVASRVAAASSDATSLKGSTEATQLSAAVAARSNAGGGRSSHPIIPPPVTIIHDDPAERFVFRQALATANSTVTLANGLTLDLTADTSDAPLQIAGGVTLQGGRSGLEPGGGVFTSNHSAKLFTIVGDNVHVTGLRIAGPAAGATDNDSDTGGGISLSSRLNVEIDNNAITGFGGAAIVIDDSDHRIDQRSNPNSVHVHDNYIAHNQHIDKFGYGVSVGAGAYALIERNYFDDNRHAITGDGTPGNGYLAFDNLVGPLGGKNWDHPQGDTHVFDMHGTDSCLHLGFDYDRNCGPAGYSMVILRNSFLYIDGPTIKLRGTPHGLDGAYDARVGMFVDENVFKNDDKNDAIQQTETGLTTGASNVFDRDFSGEVASCDFDGDGVQDDFMTTGVTWWYRSGGASRGGVWTYLNTSTARLGDVQHLGDVDGDGRCDVIVGTDVYSGGVFPRRSISLTGSEFVAAQDYTAPAPSLDFGLPSSWDAISGDFDNDGKGDYARLGATGAWVFYGIGDGGFTRTFQSYVDDAPPLDFGSPSPWQTITGDFNGDGRTDYARVGDTGAWLFFGNANHTFTRGFQSYLGQFPYSSIPSTWQAIAGDFNGDGTTDYARLGDTRAYVFFGSASGLFAPSLQSYTDPSLNFGAPSTWQTIVGDFNGDATTDYARLGDTGAWLFFGHPNRIFTTSFQCYVDESLPLNFGAPSTWQVIAGDFNGDHVTDYARLGDTGAWVFLFSPDGSATRVFQSYVDESPPLNFGAPSTWQVIAGDFNCDGTTDYARLGSTGAWMFYGESQLGKPLATSPFAFRREFQPAPAFADLSSYQVVTGKFGGAFCPASYARLGATKAYVFWAFWRLAW